MGTYQAPQVPQPGVTFGDERFVDPWAATMLQNICSNLQVQNMALQQENAALKNKSQSLQQQRENPLCKAANRAYLREFTAYKTESLVEFPDGRYHLVKKNPLGELYKVVKPVSDCTEFSARYVIDPRDGSTSIEVRYRLPNGTLSGFRVADDKFQQNALIQGFYKSGGTLRCGKDGPRLFYMLVAQLLSKHEIYFQPIPGWNINASRWFFKESAGCEAPLDSPILRPDALTSEDQMMMAAVIGLSFLKTRLPEDMQPTKPFAVISESFSITTEITLNCKLAELKKQLNHHRDDLLIHVRGGFASNRYQKATNYDYLSDEAEKGSTSRSIYIVQAKELTPEIREHCIPMKAVGTYVTREEAEAVRAEMMKRPATPYQDSTLQDCFRMFKESREYKGRSDKARELYDIAWKYLRPLWHFKIAALYAQDFQNILDKMADNGLSQSMLEKERTLISKLYRTAIGWRVVDANLASVLKVEGRKSPEREIFTDEQVTLILSQKNTPTGQMVIALLACGVRIYELLHFKHEDFHRTESGAYLIGGCKTEAGRNRIIPILDFGIPVFEHAYATSVENGPLFPNGKGGFWNEKNWRNRKFYPFLEEIGIQPNPYDENGKRKPEFAGKLATYTPYTTRHTYASLCDRAGVNKDILKRAVGHTPKSKTLDEVYLHPKATQMIEAFDKANQLVNDEVLTTTKA